MRQRYKIKTFLYYLPDRDFILKIFPSVKICSYILLNILILINPYVFLNILSALLILLYLYLIGFVRYRESLFRILFISLLLFFSISYAFQLISVGVSNITWIDVEETFFFILPFFGKWLIINMSGLLLFVSLSQGELVEFLRKLRIDFRILVSVTIAFNMISRLLEAIDEMNMSLDSRGVRKSDLRSLFGRIQHIFVAMIIDSIEYISSLRATYAFDYDDIEKEYEK
jgi:energy-coupling factor transporter transmembrane protein EcfT